MSIIISDRYNSEEDGLRYQMTGNKILVLLVCDPRQVYDSGLCGLQITETQFKES